MDRELELILDGRSHKSGWGQAWVITKSITSFAWCGTKFVAKNTPAALGAAWEVKKEISNEIVKSIHEVKKEQKLLEIENEIKLLKKDI
jgi:hypothetical protein